MSYNLRGQTRYTVLGYIIPICAVYVSVQHTSHWGWINRALDFGSWDYLNLGRISLVCLHLYYNHLNLHPLEALLLEMSTVCAHLNSIHMRN